MCSFVCCRYGDVGDCDGDGVGGGCVFVVFLVFVPPSDGGVLVGVVDVAGQCCWCSCCYYTCSWPCSFHLFYHYILVFMISFLLPIFMFRYFHSYHVVCSLFVL